MLTKTWSTKADFEAGTLNNVWVPEGLNRLELKRLALSGTATYIVFGAEGWSNPHNRVMNWQDFEHTNPNQNIYYRDDFRDNSLEAWTIVGGTWQAVNQQMGGSGNISWQTNRIRVGPTSWEGLDILMKAYRVGTADHRFFLRADSQGYSVNAYVLLIAGATGPVNRGWVKNGTVNDYVKVADGADQANTWNWIRVQVFTEAGNVVTRLKWWLPGESEPGWKASYTWPGIWRSAGCFSLGRHTGDPGKYNYYDDFLISRMEGIPSPPNCSVSFKFWPSKDGVKWGSESSEYWKSEYTDIKLVPNACYIKVQATLSRDSLLSAMPTLESMSLIYKLLVQPVFF